MTRTKLGTVSPDRYIIIESEHGLVKVYTANALGAKDPGNRITLETVEARGVARILNELYPPIRPLPWALFSSIFVNLVLLGLVFLM